MEANVAKKKAHVQNNKLNETSKTKNGMNKRKRSRSRGKRMKKKSKGIGCCRKKASKSKNRKRSKVKRNQPKLKNIKPVQVPNEDLGEIVLVKNAIQGPLPGTASKENEIEKKEVIMPQPVPPPPATHQGIKSDNGSKKKANETDNDNEMEKEKEKEKENEKENEKKKEEEKEKEKEESKEEKKEKMQDSPKTAKIKTEDNEEKGKLKLEEKKEKLMELAKKISDEGNSLPAREFESIGSYIPAFVSKVNFTENMAKNRFTDVICMDHSRVALHDGCYIHASWVDIDANRKVILTQFPLRNCASDFWQMVIEQRVKCVVLWLTEREYDSLGGNFVFPQNQDFIHFADRSIRVGEFKQVQLAKGWIMRVLSVTNGTYKSFVHVHHYKLWAHDGIPPNVKSIWQLQSASRKYSGPLVYMSLSGCGRAGTFALLEAAHSVLHTDASFELEKLLERIRNGRMHAVQNMSQYSFVYCAIAEHFIGNAANKFLKSGGDESNEEETMQKLLKSLIIQ